MILLYIPTILGHFPSLVGFVFGSRLPVPCAYHPDFQSAGKLWPDWVVSQIVCLWLGMQ